jgi:hypothetical protein
MTSTSPKLKLGNSLPNYFFVFDKPGFKALLFSGNTSA